MAKTVNYFTKFQAELGGTNPHFQWGKSQARRFPWPRHCQILHLQVQKWHHAFCSRISLFDCKKMTKKKGPQATCKGCKDGLWVVGGQATSKSEVVTKVPAEEKNTRQKKHFLLLCCCCCCCCCHVSSLTFSFRALPPVRNGA